MRKFISLSLIGLLIHCFYTNLQAQSSQSELDQVELMKQFIGTWEAEWGEDTVIWVMTPLEKGYEHIIHRKTKEGTFLYLTGIGGFTDDYKTCLWYFLRPNGAITRNMGEFLSNKKIKFKRYDHYHKDFFRTYEITLHTPDKLTEIVRWKSEDGTWDDANVFELTYTRVKNSK